MPVIEAMVRVCYELRLFLVLFISSGPSALGEGDSEMPKNKFNTLLTIDLTIHFRGVLYQLRLSDVAKWIIPLAVIAYRIFRIIHS